MSIGISGEVIEVDSHAHQPPSLHSTSEVPPTDYLTKADYERLANLRYALRRFSRQTELEARRVGLTPQQYLLLLALKGFPGRDWANITELAERLQIRHNAVIGLINRAEERGLVRRAQDPAELDKRMVYIHITPAGESLLNTMSTALRSERQRVRLALEAADEMDNRR